MQVEDINAIDAKISHAARDLILQKARSDAVTSGGNVLGGKNSALNIFLKKILIGISRHFAVGREIAGFSAKHQLVARIAFSLELHQRRADAAFAALKAVIDRGIGNVDSILHGRHDRRGVRRVGALVGLAEIGANADG